MIIRCRASVKIAGTALAQAALAACGSHGAPPYAPETPRVAASAVPPQSPAASSAASTAGTPTASSMSAGANSSLGMPAGVMAAPSDPHAVYDLREKCGADARDWSQRETTASHGLTSHYNIKLNECFAVTTSSGGNVDVRRLVNVLENREIGFFSLPADPAAPMQCHVAASLCRSREEWQSLTAPYMND